MLRGGTSHLFSLWPFDCHASCRLLQKDLWKLCSHREPATLQRNTFHISLWLGFDIFLLMCSININLHVKNFLKTCPPNSRLTTLIWLSIRRRSPKPKPNSVYGDNEPYLSVFFVAFSETAALKSLQAAGFPYVAGVKSSAMLWTNRPRITHIRSGWRADIKTAN